MAAELGRFAEGFASWRRVLAGVPPTARLTVFENAANDVAQYIAKGLDRVTASDELYDIAVTNNVAEGDDDVVQGVIARAFYDIEAEHVLDDIPEVDHGTNGKGNGKDSGPHAQAYVLPDPALIPPRRWFYGKHYMAGVVTGTVAPGGFGKTSLSLFEALEMTKLGLRVWYISGEDDRDELDRRIAAYVQRHGLAPMQIAGSLFIDDKMSFPLKIAKMGKGGAAVNENELAAFEAAIIADRIDVVILDPFVSFHSIPENDTGGMDIVVKRLGEIAMRRKCCIEISHHVRKPATGQTEITVYDARGAGAIVNAVRSCRVLNQMNMVEAQQAKIDLDKRWSYIRVDPGKRNMAPPDKAHWRKLSGIKIANGDDVGVIERWEYPKVFAEVTPDDFDWVRGLVLAKDYRTDSRSEQWLGHEVARKFERKPIKTSPTLYSEGDRKWLNLILKGWEGKAFKREKRDDEHRHEREYYVPLTDRRKAAAVVRTDPDEQEDMPF
jgi:hypothetical protein